MCLGLVFTIKGFVVNFPYTDSNILTTPAYGVYVTTYSNCEDFDDLCDRNHRLTTRYTYTYTLLCSTSKRFSKIHMQVFDKFRRSVRGHIKIE